MRRTTIVLTALLFVIPLVGADGPDPVAGAQDVGTRTVNVGVDAGRAVLDYGRDNDSAADSLHVALDPRSGTLWVRNNDGAARSTNAITMRLEQLVEFVDQDGDGNYTPSADKVLRSYAPRDMAWQTLPVRNTGDGHTLLGVGIMRDGGGKLAWAVDTRGKYDEPDAPRLVLSGLDVAFELAGWKPTEPAARLALVVTYRQQGTLAGLAQGAPFPWPSMIRVNGVDESVAVGNTAGSIAGKTVLSFGAGTPKPVSAEETAMAVRFVACAMRFEC